MVYKPTSVNTANQIFEQMVLEARKKDVLGTKAKTALNWYQRRTQQLAARKFLTSSDIQRSNLKRVKTVEWGSMYFYRYNPKHRQTLPYYDEYPCVLIVKKLEDGFQGINWHYLPYIARAKLLDGLLRIKSDSSYDENTRLRVTYEYLQSVARLRYFKPCFKRYLYSHIGTQFIGVNALEYPVAIFMPVERFRKQSKYTVWKESIQQINK